MCVCEVADGGRLWRVVDGWNFDEGKCCWDVMLHEQCFEIVNMNMIVQ